MGPDCPNCTRPVEHHIAPGQKCGYYINGGVVVCSTDDGTFIHRYTGGPTQAYTRERPHYTGDDTPGDE